jgi:hypothetical protein
LQQREVPTQKKEKAPIPEASLFDIMQRIGISCTKEQVEKLELLGVIIQRNDW